MTAPGLQITTKWDTTHGARNGNEFRRIMQVSQSFYTIYKIYIRLRYVIHILQEVPLVSSGCELFPSIVTPQDESAHKKLSRGAVNYL